MGRRFGRRILSIPGGLGLLVGLVVGVWSKVEVMGLDLRTAIALCS
jgi:hypothetical protein